MTVTVDGDALTVDACTVHPIDDTISDKRSISEIIDGFKQRMTDVVFAQRGLAIYQPLVRIEEDLPNISSDLAASTILADLCTDAFCTATGVQIAMTSNGLMRTSLSRGRSGVQTV